MIVDAVIPALDEEENILHVLAGLEERGLRRVVVVDNGSKDQTAELALQGGAQVIYEKRRGYGSACLAGLAHLALDPPDTVLFLDADGADDPDDITALLGPIERNEAELVIGSRTTGEIEAGALTPVQHFGNVLSCVLIRLIFGVKFTDLGPFRAIRWAALERLEMADPDFGWTVEMQAKAARRKVRCQEVPVHCKNRFAGESKISGTVRGSIRAGSKILYTIGREAIR
jgi:glycosyltransferase involved in cell wall biosynthesis